MPETKITTNNIKILESYKILKKYFDDVLLDISTKIYNEDLDCIVLKNRSRFSCKMEWACHNFLYSINIKRGNTADVDLNYPQKCWEKVLYPICGVLVWIFVK